MEKDIINILTLIYGNYELDLYDNEIDMAHDIYKLISNYRNHKDIYEGFIKG